MARKNSSLLKKKEELVDYWKTSRIINDQRVIKAFENVDRENFVLSSHKTHAYDDVPLPIFEGQTISQPTTVMIMTQALQVDEGNKVLEVGTGSGYQTAILGELAEDKGKVVSIELLEKLHLIATKNLKGRKNIKLVLGDGSLGYESEAPYDRIIVTAAAPSIPEELVEQLANNGLMIIPVTQVYGLQNMMRIRKNGEGRRKTESLGEFSFVPLRGEKGYKVAL